MYFDMRDTERLLISPFCANVIDWGCHLSFCGRMGSGNDLAVCDYKEFTSFFSLFFVKTDAPFGYMGGGCSR